ncbi:MAG: alpha/beta fold hydrolase [Lysobacter sp.]
MVRSLIGAALALALSVPVAAEVPSYPAAFRTQDIAANGATLHVRVGGQGPAVVLLHGMGDTGDMWAPLARELVRNHTVVIPDLRGMGLSSHPQDGYDKRNQAADVRAVLAALGIDRATVVGHDIGLMVAFAYAARYRQLTDKLVVMDAPVPGIPPWEQTVRNPTQWHFDFGGKDIERLLVGRERIYLDRFWNEFANHPDRIDEATRQHYAALYARPGGMHSVFAQFHAMRQDAEDNRAVLANKLTLPVLAIGGEKSNGENTAVMMRNAATDVTGTVIPDAGHWLMEEAPGPTISAVRGFIDAR